MHSIPQQSFASYPALLLFGGECQAGGYAKLPRELVLRREEAGRYGATECWYLFTKADSTLWVEHVWSHPKDDDTSDVGSETKPPEQILANNDDEEL